MLSIEGSLMPLLLLSALSKSSPKICLLPTLAANLFAETEIAVVQIHALRS